jgi:hypothetical protein
LVGTKKLSCTVSEVLSKGDFSALWGCLSVLPELLGVWFGISATTRRCSWSGANRLATTAL